MKNIATSNPRTAVVAIGAVLLAIAALLVPGMLAKNTTIAKAAPVVAQVLDSQVGAAEALSTSNQYSDGKCIETRGVTCGRIHNNGSTWIGVICSTGASKSVAPKVGGTVTSSKAVCTDTDAVVVGARCKVVFSNGMGYKTYYGPVTVYLSDYDHVGATKTCA